MFFRQNKSGEVTLIVDIGSSSVGAALVSISKSATPKILFSTRSPVVLQNDSERGRSLVAVTTALEAVMNTIATEHVIVRKTHIIFSSPWFTSETKIIKSEYDSSVLVTHHVIEQLIKDAENKLVEESKSKNGEIIEHRIVRTKINGYNTLNPYNKKAKNIEIAFLSSVVEKDISESVRRVIGKHLHVHKNDTSSFSLVAFTAISGILSDITDFLVVDVRGEVTDLSLVIDSALMKNLSFSQGKHTLVKAVADGSGQSATAALSALCTAIRGGSEPTVQAGILKLTETFKQTWLQEYMKTIQDISAGTTNTIVPQTVFLIVDPDIEVFFEKILNEIKNDSNLHLLKHLNIRGFVDAASVPTDQFLALESIFVTMI